MSQPPRLPRPSDPAPDRRVLGALLLSLALSGVVSGCTTFTREADTLGGPSADGVAAVDGALADGGGTVDTTAPADVPDAGGRSDGHLGDAAGDTAPSDAGVPDVADSGSTPDATTDVVDAGTPPVDVGTGDTVEPMDVPPSDVEDPCPAEPCVTPGLHVCTPDAAPVVLICEPGLDGCLTWSVAETCAAGLTCKDGSCGADTCGASGDVECVPGGAGYRICGADADGFLVWGPPFDCSAGETCNGAGACGSDGCSVEGQTVCFGVSQRIVCEKDAKGFLSWSAPTKCPADGVCKGDGVCGLDACPFVGQPECLPPDSWRVCGSGPDGFLQWGEPLPCPVACVDGVGCGDACVEGEKACSGTTSTVTCVPSADGPVWGDATACAGKDQVCKGAGACGKDQCLVAGSRQCSTVDGNQTLICNLEPSGFMKYGPGTPCEPGEVCRGAGICGADACVDGAVDCIDGASLRVCELGASGFFQWSAPFQCSAGSLCLDAAGCTPEAAVTLNVGTDDPVSSPAVAALGGGATVVAWTRALAGSTAVLVRTVDGALEPQGSLETLVTPADLTSAQSEPSVAGAQDGSYMVAWTATEGAASSVRATVLGGASVGAGPVSSPGGDNGHPAAVAVPGGGYLVVWESTGAPCGSARCFLQRRFGADGAPATDVAVAFDGSGKQQLIRPSVAVTPNGGAWLAGRRLTDKSANCWGFFPCIEPPCCKDAGVVQTVAAVGLAADGDVTVLPTTMDTSTGGSLGSPSVAVHPTTGVARLVWVGEPLFQKQGVRFGCLDPAGSGCKVSFVSKGGGVFPTGARLVGLVDGSYVAAWASPPASGAKGAVYTRRVGADGAVLTDPSQASLGLGGEHATPALVRRSDGVAAVVWVSSDGAANAVRMRIVKP